MLKRVKRAYYCLIACLILAGAVFLFVPDITLNVVCWTFGILMIIYGVVKIFGYFSKDLYQLAFQHDFALGLIAMVIGILFIIRTSGVKQLLATCIGIIIVIDSALKIQTAIESKKFGISSWWLILASAILVAVLGILLIVLPGETTQLCVRLIGINLCMDGLLNFFVVKNTVREVKLAAEEFM